MVGAGAWDPVKRYNHSPVIVPTNHQTGDVMENYKCDDEKADLTLVDETATYDGIFKDAQEVQTTDFDFIVEDIPGFDYGGGTSVQQAKANTFNVYPNPASALINIEVICLSVIKKRSMNDEKTIFGYGTFAICFIDLFLWRKKR